MFWSPRLCAPLDLDIKSSRLGPAKPGHPSYSANVGPWALVWGYHRGRERERERERERWERERERERGENNSRKREGAREKIREKKGGGGGGGGVTITQEEALVGIRNEVRLVRIFSCAVLPIFRSNVKENLENLWWAPALCITNLFEIGCHIQGFKRRSVNHEI